jgi:hypothetical protein
VTTELTIDGYAKDAEFTKSIARDGVTYCVSVSLADQRGKVGLGYEGDWMITATTTRGQMIYNNKRLRIPVGKTHAQVAYMVVDIATADGEF